MDRARDQLLAGAALAAEQHGGVVGDDPPDQLVNFLHRGAAADDLAADELAIHFVLEAVEIGGLRATSTARLTAAATRSRLANGLVR